jgi:pilus assembly protein TadC
MTKMRRQQKKGMNKTVRILKQRFISLIAFLTVSVTILMVRAGENWWPVWVVDYRSRIIGILLLMLVVVILSSPLIIESAQRPREFPGPGKNPYIDP